MGRQGKIMLDVPSGTLAAMAVLGMAFLLGGGAGCLLTASAVAFCTLRRRANRTPLP